MRAPLARRRRDALCILAASGLALEAACSSYSVSGTLDATADGPAIADAPATDAFDAQTPDTTSHRDTSPDVNVDALVDAPKDTAPDGAVDASPPEAAPIDASPDAVDAADGQADAQADGAIDALPDVAPDTQTKDAPADVFVPPLTLGTSELISVSTLGTQGNGDSTTPWVSNNARYVAFRSTATNLVPSDSNGSSDVFLRDRAEFKTIAVSALSNGTTGNGDSINPSMAPSGTFIVFASFATNLIAGDTNGKPDLFLYDVTTASLERVSVTHSGDEANDETQRGSVSNTGRYVTFDSSATNLVTGDTNGVRDIFLRDRLNKTTTRISIGVGNTQSNGVSQRPHISGDGRFVVFESDATNLVTNDTNSARDIFAYEIATGATVRLTALASGVEANSFSDFATISENATFAVFRSAATNFAPGDTPNTVDVFRVNLSGTREFARISAGSPAMLPTSRLTVTSDGTLIAFDSSNTFASSAVDTNSALDVWVSDLTTLPPGNPTLRSVTSSGNSGNAASSFPWLSSDGSYCAYETKASNIGTMTDTNGLSSDIVLLRVR